MPSFEFDAPQPMNSMTAFFDAQRAGDTHIAAQLRNQLAGQTLDSNVQTAANTAESGSLANQLATAKNPLEIIQLRQQLGLDASPTLDKLRDLYNGGGDQPPVAAPDGPAPAGGDGISGNPLLGPLPAFDLAGRPLSPANGAAPAPGGGAGDVNQPPGPDHPALPAIRDFATKLMALPPEQRPAAYQAMLPAMKQAGAIHAPDQYPGDDAVSHLASGAPLPVQVAGPGAPTGSALAADPNQPTPGYLPPAATPGPADDVIARLRAAQQPAQPDQNGLVPLMSPDGTPPPVPVNPLAGSAPQAGPSFMPAASAQPPAQPPAAQPGTGMNSPQVQQAQELLRRATQIEMAAAQTPNDPRAKATAAAMAADLKQRAAILMQADSVSIDPVTRVQTHSLTGGETSAAEPLRNPARVTKVEGAGGTILTQPGAPDLVIPYGGRPEQEAAYKADLPKAEALTTAAQSSQASMPRLNEMSELIPQLATGPTAELRARGAAILESLGVRPEVIKTWTGMSSGSQAQELIKYSISTAGAAAKADVGANNGIQSTQLYQSANPGILLLPDANKHVTNMLRMSAQQIQDYAQAALQHFGANEAAFLQGGNYAPLTAFNRAWLAQNNPRIGEATIGILNGDPFAKWSAHVSPQEAQSAVGMASRIDPNVMVPTRGGIPQRATEMLAHPNMPAPPVAQPGSGGP